EYRIEQLTAGEDPAWGAHQHPEQRRLTLGQFDTDTADGAATYGAGHPIQAEPADAQCRATVGSAQQGRHPGEQFWYFERFDQIVLRAGVEAVDPVRDRPPRGEQQCRGFDIPGSEYGDQLGTVHYRQSAIDDHGVIAAGEPAVQP